MNRKLTMLLAALLAAMLLIAGCGGTDNKEAGKKDTGKKATQHYSFASSGTGGTFYVAASAISSLISTKVPGLEITAEVTKGVVENVRLMASKQSDMGFAYGSTAYEALNGEGDFKNRKVETLRGVANIHDGALNIVALKKSGIKTLADLADRKVSIGPKGSGSAAVASDFLKVIGLLDKIKVSNLSFDDSASSLRDGHIDAFIIGGTTPVPALIELESTHEMVIVPVDDANRKKYLDARPYHVEYIIPAGGYKSVKEPIKTVGYTVIWVAREDVPEDVIYNMLKAMNSEKGRGQLVKIQAAFKEMSPGVERFEKIKLPLHPGAKKFYSEQKK